jgi:two-component system chemotaxis sensor kinase CheA
MDDLIKEFIEETSEMLSEIDADLIQLESDPNNSELLDKIFRLMHTIKGTCGFIGLSRLEKTAHVAENMLDGIRCGNIEVDETLITLLFMSIDRVRFIVSEVGENGAEPAGNDDDINQLIEKEIAARESGGSVAKATSMTEMDTPQQEKEAVTNDESTEIILPEPLVVTEVAKIQGVASVPTHKTAKVEATEFLKVPVPVLESMIDMVSELVLSRNQLLQKARMEENSSFHASFQRLNRIVSDLQDVVMKTRMQPIGNAWGKLPRIVRELSNELGKKIVLETNGEETELDRQVLELIKDPLTHMIRNSCDHGIEKPEDRKACGKRERGTIKLGAYHEGGLIIIKISDDGKGLDPKKIGEKAVEKGLVSPEKLHSMNDKQILSFIMRPGFSTAEQITNISGRGVGMDVVRANIEKIGGSIDIDSQPDKGSTFTIKIPLTLAIISGLIVEMEGNRYAIPQVNIQELVSLGHANNDMVEYINHKPVLRLRDKVVPLLDSPTLFKSKTDGMSEKEKKFIVVLTTGSCTFGIIVDKIYDTEEVVIKSVSSVLRNTHIYSGNSILGDGQVIMILDPGGIARHFNVERDIAQASEEEQKNSKAVHIQETVSMLIFKAGEGAPKGVPLPLVSRLQVFDTKHITHSGGKYVINYNNQIINLVLADPATQALKGDEVTAIMLSDDRSESTMGILIDELIDINECVADLSMATARDGIMGSTRYGDRIADVIDVSYYMKQDSGNWFSMQSHSTTSFAPVSEVLETPNSKVPGESRNGHAPPVPPSHNGKARVLVVDDSNFFRSMLNPILSAAGYNVTMAEDATQAIRLHDEGMMYDIILSDIEMPEINGYEFVEKMRDENSQWKQTPFVAITSHNTPQDINYGYQKGFNHYIGKFDKQQLLAAMESVRFPARQEMKYG